MTGTLPLSLCMIVRDEEHSLASCLASVRSLVKEIVVVDTGSTDRTREVATAAGARVYDFCWNDDFAAARNFSLELATGEWILVLDADEILEPVKPEEMARLLAVDGVEGYFVTVRSYLDTAGYEAVEDMVVRLFRNRPVYRFEGAIHEQVAGSIKRQNNGGGLACSGLILHHMGYLCREVGSKDKRGRNIRVIKKALACRPSDPFLLYSLGIEYILCDRTDEGIECLERALRGMKGDEGYCRDLLIALSLGLLKTARRKRLREILDAVYSACGEDPAFSLIEGMLRFSEGSYERAVERLRCGLKDGMGILPSSQVFSLIGDACSHLGRYEEALKEYIEALRINPMWLYPLARILRLRQSGWVAVDWGHLSGFASLEVKRYLRDQLKEMGELPLAVVLSLLMVIEAVGKNGRDILPAICREHLAVVQVYREGGLIREYLLIAAKEISLNAEAKQRWPHLSVLIPCDRVWELAVASLEVVVKDFERR